MSTIGSFDPSLIAAAFKSSVRAFGRDALPCPRAAPEPEYGWDPTNNRAMMAAATSAGTLDPAPKKWTGSDRHALHVGR